MSGYTLISCIGTGQSQDGEYEPVVYRFPDGEDYKAAFFLGALLKSKKYQPIKEIVIVGTRTSHWHLVFDDLLENIPSEEYKDLREQIKGQSRLEEGVSEELLDKLGDILIEKLGVSATIIAHTPDIDAKTVPEIFPYYHSMISGIDGDTEIVLDITHGFRSMPLLVYQALQFGFAGQPERKVHIVYGDLKKGAPSIARDLSEYWRLSALTGAESLFINRFDGKMLASLIKNDWGEGSILISRFTTIVECNFSLEILQWIGEAKKALERPLKEDESSLIADLREKIRHIVDEIARPSTSDTLLAYARLLEEKGLYVQSIITLQTAVETRAIEAYGTSEEIGRYDAWKRHEQQCWSKIYELHVYSKLKDIMDMRNKIAHGGTRDHDNKGKGIQPRPTAATIRRLLKESRDSVETYFNNMLPVPAGTELHPMQGSEENIS